MNKDKVGKRAISLSKYISPFTWIRQSILSSSIQANQRRNNTKTCQWKSTFYPQDYTTINRRINRLDIKIKEDSKGKEFEDDYIVIAIDSTGIKVTNRGQWMRDKWKARNNKNKGYLKIHIAVNVKSKKILSMKITDEHVHDSKVLPQLVEDIIKSDSMASIGKLFADGAYDGNDIFIHLSDNGILPCVKVRKNAKVQLKKGNILRNLSVISQKNDLQKWKDKR